MESNYQRRLHKPAEWELRLRVATRTDVYAIDDLRRRASYGVRLCHDDGVTARAHAVRHNHAMWRVLPSAVGGHMSAHLAQQDHHRGAL